MTALTANFTAQPVEAVGQAIAPIPPLTLAAFACTSDVAESLLAMQASRHMARVKSQVYQGGLDGAMQLCTHEGAPQLLVIETDAEMAPLLAQLEALAELCDPETRVLIIGGSNDIRLYRELMRQGISDYLPRPVTPEQILRSISDIFSQPGALAKGAVTACLGTSGGVGSSTVALNTAWLMGQQRNGVVNLVDLDLDFGTAGLSLALEGGRGIAEALAAGENLDGQLLDGLFDSYDAHLRVLTTSDGSAMTAEPSVEVLDHLTDLARSGGHRVVLDLPGFGNAMTRQAVKSADHVIVTTTPDLAGLKNCRKLLEMIADLRPAETKPLVVLNRQGMAKKQEIGARDFAQTLGIELTAMLGFDPKGFIHATNLGKVHVATPAGKAAAAALQPLVAALGNPAAAAHVATKPLLSRLLHRG